jgi:uncharacterized repeat protein (TIGR01451 family)
MQDCLSKQLGVPKWGQSLSLFLMLAPFTLGTGMDAIAAPTHPTKNVTPSAKVHQSQSSNPNPPNPSAAETAVTSTLKTATESATSALYNEAQIQYQSLGQKHEQILKTNQITLERILPLIDPQGQIFGCGGNLLDDYTGYSIGVYAPVPGDPTQSELGALLDLTTTEVPDIPNDSIPAGILPNGTNQNPYALTNEAEGRYSFLLDRNRGQLQIGSVYILVVNPPANSRYNQRRIKINILNITPFGSREQVSYRATSLDGMPIGVEGEMSIDQTTVFISDADRIGLQLLAVQFNNTLCQTSQVRITKSGDRANAAPGDTVIYRLSIDNISDGSIDSFRITDTLPQGFSFLQKSLRAQTATGEVPITATVTNERTVVFSTTAVLPMDGKLTVVYAAQLTPDALRGDGENRANVRAQRVDNDLVVSDGPARHRVRVNSGIINNCGTLIGRVFVDANGDGEQQTGEVGVPNAVVFMDDGNRVTADDEGLFSVKCVLPGSRTGVLDLTSIPGYELGTNAKFIERNSPSRLVRLTPGGMGRLNFGVVPKAGVTPSPKTSQAGES